jgi:hypothetical protein
MECQLAAVIQQRIRHIYRWRWTAPSRATWRRAATSRSSESMASWSRISADAMEAGCGGQVTLVEQLLSTGLRLRRPWWTKPGNCSRFALLRLGQLLRQLIKRGLLLPGNLRCLDMLRLPRK